jgi:hypothetical protein
MRRRLGITLLGLAVLLSGGFAVEAQEPAKKGALVVEKGDSVRAVLARHVDKKVTLVLVQGTEMTGTVRLVGEHVVHLSELAGKEFFDAAVDLEKIAAVVVRAR